MAESRTARIRLNAPGLATIEIDGQDVSKGCVGFRLDGRVGECHQLTLDLHLETGEAEGQAVVHIRADTAATLVALGWTPPDDAQPVDLTHPSRHDQIMKIIKAEARRDPDWFRTLLRREERIQGRPLGRVLERRPRRAVRIDGVLTEGDADTAREALRQMDDDPHGLKAGMVVQPYTDHGQRKWVFRCWGTDDCGGLLSLDHSSKGSAESARDRHTAEAHTADGTAG